MCNFPWKHLIFWKKKWSRPISHEYKTMLVFTSQKQSYRPWDPANQKTGSTKHELLSSMPIHWGYTPSLPNHPSSQQKNQAALAPALVFYEMKPAVVAEDRLLGLVAAAHPRPGVLPEVFGSCYCLVRLPAYPTGFANLPEFKSSLLEKLPPFSRMSLPIWESCNLWSCNLSATFLLQNSSPGAPPMTLLRSRTCPMLPAVLKEVHQKHRSSGSNAWRNYKEQSEKHIVIDSKSIVFRLL